MRVVALLGLSGVGKSTIVRQLASSLPLTHLEASQLLKDGFARREQAAPSSEELRLGDVSDNQTLLIESFRLATENVTGLVIFDGHLLIDGRNGIVEIPTEVYSALGVSAVVYLTASPETIAQRRQQDTARMRPDRDPAELASHQSRELELARELSTAKSLPILVTSSDELPSLIAFITAGEVRSKKQVE